MSSVASDHFEGGPNQQHAKPTPRLPGAVWGVRGACLHSHSTRLTQPRDRLPLLSCKTDQDQVTRGRSCLRGLCGYSVSKNPSWCFSDTMSKKKGNPQTGTSVRDRDWRLALVGWLESQPGTNVGCSKLSTRKETVYPHTSPLSAAGGTPS
ncbi:unnamed protein product [Lepidochelys kempii]